MIQKFTATFLRSTPLATDVFQYDFKWDGTPVEFAAGQFFMLEVQDAQGKVNRAYSVASAPGQEDGFSLCVKLIPEGRGSQLFRELQVGARLNFMGPFGHFMLADSPKDIVMVATGTGLAPFVSMLPVLWEGGRAGSVDLYFGVRHEEDLFYVDTLRAWETAHPNFHAHITLSQPSDAWTGLRGRVTDHLKDLNFHRIQVYICGNGDMVKAVKEQMDAAGVPKVDIHLEQFTTF